MPAPVWVNLKMTRNPFDCWALHWPLTSHEQAPLQGLSFRCPDSGSADALPNEHQGYGEAETMFVTISVPSSGTPGTRPLATTNIALSLLVIVSTAVAAQDAPAPAPTLKFPNRYAYELSPLQQKPYFQCDYTGRLTYR